MNSFDFLFLSVPNSVATDLIIDRGDSRVANAIRNGRRPGSRKLEQKPKVDSLPEFQSAAPRSRGGHVQEPHRTWLSGERAALTRARTARAEIVAHNCNERQNRGTPQAN